MKTRSTFLFCAAAVLALLAASSARAQGGGPGLERFIGESVPEDIVRMVERAQLFLVRQQGADGVWPNPNGEAGAGIQGYSLLALLATGEDPRHGRFAPTIKRGLDALLKQQDANGYMGPSMYHHGFATLALAELYGMVDDPRVGKALQKAVDLILDAQRRNPMEGWRYAPTFADADTTVSGAQIVALFAARNAGLEIPDDAMDKALKFVRSCMGDDGGIGYTAKGGGGSPPRNAIAVTVASMAGERNQALMRAAFRWLNANGDEKTSSYYFYYIYYAAQAYFRADMAAWRAWNRELANRLAQMQNGQGGWDGPHGTTFCTAAAVLSMAPNFRYLPIYER